MGIRISSSGLAGIILLYVQALNFNSKKQKIEFFSELLILPIIFALTSWAGVIAILILLVLNGLWIIINNPIKNYWYKCSICGKEIEASEYCDTVPVMCDNPKCFHTYFWKEKIRLLNSGDKDYAKAVAIVNHEHYIIGPEYEGNTHFAGRGGSLFTIKFNDGRIVKTRNLWSQGTITEEYYKDLPDNAVFI